MKKYTFIVALLVAILCLSICGCTYTPPSQPQQPTPCNHDYDRNVGYVTITQPTETSMGVAKATCILCGNDYNFVLPKLNATPSITLHYVVDGAIILSEEYEKPLQLPQDPQKENLVFDGWYLNTTFTTKLSDAALEGKSGNVFVYSKWKEKTNDNDGNQGGNGDNGGNGGNQGDNNDVVVPDPLQALATILAKYDNYDKWNFTVGYTLTMDGESTTTEYSYKGDDLSLTYPYDGVMYTEYFRYYDDGSGVYYYQLDDGTYQPIYEGDADYDDLYASIDILELCELGDLTFKLVQGKFVATQPQVAGEMVFGEYDGDVWTSFCITVKDGEIHTIEADVTNTFEGYVTNYSYYLTFSNHGKVNFDIDSLPLDGGGTTTPIMLNVQFIVDGQVYKTISVDTQQTTSISVPDPTKSGYTFDGWYLEETYQTRVTLQDLLQMSGTFDVYCKWAKNSSVNTNMMPNQTYNPSSFDNSNMMDKMDEFEYAAGLPSTGNVNALVVPVQIGNYTISANDLERLEIAFNGTSQQTGWHSVKSYYEASSYGNLNLNFDVFPQVYKTKYNDSHYDSTYAGDVDILEEVLGWIEDKIDLTQYDNNADGILDAVYLIYSAPVDYYDDSIYWAFVSYYEYDTTYDGLNPYYYLFAGFDFMDENTSSDEQSFDGLNVNASTYIHETAHLLSIDDYYDYDTSAGSNKGLGCADMMDYTVGDHNPYTKIIMGWVTPTIVTSTTTINLESFVESGDCLLIPLNFNNSYFSEYLIVDFYTATDLNEMHAVNQAEYMYDGVAYGVRIFHVSSAATNPYNDDYGSFTDNNNSMSKTPLIYLVEADGTTNFSDSIVDGERLAMGDDLWKTGQSLSSVWPNFARHDGKLVNFDITINVANADGATVTVTFKN